MDIEERVIREAVFILQKNGTVRSVAKAFKVSKSTVHFDLSKRLKKLDLSLFFSVEKLLKLNLSQRHIRGGEATKLKYINKKSIRKQ